MDTEIMKILRKETMKIQCPPYKIFDLIYEHKWKQVERCVFFNKSVAAKCTGPCQSQCNANHSILHYVCQFRPTFHVVKALFKAHPHAIFEKDCKERYALHIACKHGCEPKVIKYLLEKNPEAASEFDLKGRTPLLLAYKSYVFQSGLEWCNAIKTLAEVSLMLAKECPLVINQEDNNGMTALEYAIENEYNNFTLEVLQETVTEYYRNLEKEKCRYIERINHTINSLNEKKYYTAKAA